ncbi:unnamed protein product [Linum trigynum]|uniref:RNase H type-1 domain-containing protein n=1 Tax=Linum trigynum TaxID=586398 RepID=A0AAV2CJ42_9ROSI
MSTLGPPPIPLLDVGGSSTHMQGISQLPPGHVCYFDGAVRAGEWSAMGMVLCDSTGAFVSARGGWLQGVPELAMVELVALRESVLWCVSARFTTMLLAGDAKGIIDKVRAGVVNDALGGAILQEIKWMLRDNPGFSVHFVGRQNNRASHLVTRKALSLSLRTLSSFDFCAWLHLEF